MKALKTTVIVAALVSLIERGLRTRPGGVAEPAASETAGTDSAGPAARGRKTCRRTSRPETIP